MSEDLVDLWQSSDPAEVGRRLRAARRHANLTQEELGRGIASVAYVSRLEAGARRGDLEMFVAFARRLRLSARDLIAGSEEGAAEVEVQLNVDRAELALAAGEAVDAERRVAGISDDALAGLPVDLARAVMRVRAGSYEAQGRLPAAIAEGEALTATGRRDVDWIKDVIALSRCHREAGHLDEAIKVGREAETEIEGVGLSGTTEAVQLFLTVASAYSEKGDLAHAAELCRDAIARAEALGSPVALASAYWNASVSEYEQGRLAEAVPLARRALAEFERADDSRNVGRLRGTLGVLLTQVDPPQLDEAIEVLERSRAELQASSAGRYDIGRSSWALARAHHRRGDHVVATRFLDDAMDRVDAGSPVLRASVVALRGQIAWGDDRRDDALSDYRRAVGLLTGVGSDRAAAELWFELAELFDEAGDTRSALTAYKSAAATMGVMLHGTVKGNAPRRGPADPS